MNERQRRQKFFQHRDRIAPVEQRGVRRKIELVVKAPDHIEPEPVEGADPHRRRDFFPKRFRQPLGQFARRPVRKRKNDDRRRMHALSQQRLDTPHERPRLARARSGLQLERRRAMRSGSFLCRIFLERRFRHFRFFGQLRKQKGIKDLLPDERERKSHGCGDI